MGRGGEHSDGSGRGEPLPPPGQAGQKSALVITFLGEEHRVYCQLVSGEKLKPTPFRHEVLGWTKSPFSFSHKIKNIFHFHQ